MTLPKSRKRYVVVYTGMGPHYFAQSPHPFYRGIDPEMEI